jgi:arylsulfatase A-like enzyme
VFGAPITISRRGFGVPVWASALVLASALAVACDGRDDSRVRHVLLISLDTTRADHLGSYGASGAATPALDALATEGVRFADCTAAAPTTLASHTSLMTGNYPRTHGVPRNGFVLDPGNETLAEVLGGLGFWCAAFLGSFALDRRFGFDQGFDHYDQEFDIEVGVGGGDQDQRSAERVTEAVLAHVDVVRARRGFERDGRMFLFAHYFDPHAPYLPPGHAAPGGSQPRIAAAVEAHQLAAMRAARGDAQHGAAVRAPGVASVVAHGLTRELALAPAAVPSSEDRALAALYAGEVAALDAAIGRLLVGLEVRGVLEETLVVVSADHGETFWEHPNYWNHGLAVFQTDVHVPLIVRLPTGPGPHSRAARVVTTPVSNVDIAPTILALVGGAELRCDGRSLAAALAGGALEARPVFSEATQPGPAVEPQPSELPGRWWNAAKPRAARLGALKYMRLPYLGLERLYDLAADPGEQHDVLGEAAFTAELAVLRAALDGYERSGPGLPSRFDPAQTVETQRRLEALGYFESRR